MLHEMGHLYLAELKDSDVQLYHKLMSMIDDKVLSVVKEVYPELDDTDQREEAFVELIAQIKKDDIENQFYKELEGDDGTFLGKVKTFFKDLWSSFVGKSIPDNTLFELGDNLSTVFDKIGKDMLFNDNSALKTLSHKHKKGLLKTAPSYYMDNAESIEYLKSKGYIKWICA